MNNIKNLTSGYERQAYVNDTVDKRRDPPEKKMLEQKTAEAPQDKVSLSSGVKDLQTAKQAAMAAPDVAATNREEKVEQIRTAFLEGRYQVNPEKVAEKMVGGNVSEFV